MMYQLLDSAEYTGWDAANALVPQFQRPFRFLIWDKKNEDTAPFAMGALMIVDLAVGLGSFATQLGSTIVD